MKKAILPALVLILLGSAAFANLRVVATVPNMGMLAREIGVLLYHEDLDYLLKMLDVRVLGHIEPLPGIPPTARHLRDLTSRLADIDGVVWTVDYQPEQGGRQVASQLGWDFHHLPAQVSMRGNLTDYFEMIDNWVQTIALRD